MSADLFIPLFWLVVGALVLYFGLQFWNRIKRYRQRRSSDSYDLFSPSQPVLRPKPHSKRYWLWMNLTPREMDVARLVAQGLRNSDVARELGIKENTVDAHLKSIYNKLDIHSRVELARVIREVEE